MSEPSYKVAVWGDDHLGYATRCRIHTATGLNMRDRDGRQALRDRVDAAIAEGVDLVLLTGDLFHASHPPISAIVFARQQFARLAQAGIPVVGNTGNHDAPAERGKTAATAAVHDPDRGIEMVTEPYRLVTPLDGLAIHMVSHYGLAQSERLLPEPVDGAVNLLSAHGAAMVPGHEVFRCTDSPNEQPIGLDLLLNEGFAAKLLGHYHGMDEILPGTWYAGSAIRRGFSDPPGGRGWLLVSVMSDGQVTVQPRYIDQRPQHDLPVIDATGLSGAAVEEAIRVNLSAVDLGEAIVRQVVVNCPTSVRRGIDQPALADLAASTLVWTPEFRRPLAGEDSEARVSGVSASMATAGSADLPRLYGGWASDWATANGLAESLRPIVLAEGARHLRKASEGIDGIEPEAPAPTPAPAPAPAAPQPRSAQPATPVLAGASTTDTVTGEVAPW